MISIKVPLKSILYKENGACSSKQSNLINHSNKFYDLINDRLVPSWNFIKSNVSNFANYYIEFVLLEHPNAEIPLLDKKFFDSCLRLTTVCPTERKKSSSYDKTLVEAYEEYENFLKDNCPEYHRVSKGIK